MKLLILSILATTAFALKSSKLCINGAGSDFVCNTLKAASSEDLIKEFPSIDNVSIAKEGNIELYKNAISMELLRSALKNQTNAEALNTKSKSWFQTLTKVSGQLNSAQTSTLNFVKSVASGLLSLQASIETTTTANNKKVTDIVDKANQKLSQEIDKRSVQFLSDEYKESADNCFKPVSKQVEALQTRTSKTVDKAYDSLIDLTDQIGECIKSNDLEKKCPKAIQPKLNALKSSATSAGAIGKQFENLGKKNFDKDPCLARALKRLETGVNNVLKTAPQNSSANKSAE